LPQLAKRFRHHSPAYPTSALLDGVQSRVVVGFVIGPSGAVEVPTISIVQPGWTPDFNHAVCDYLSRARFDWGAREPVRMLAVMTFDFAIRKAGAKRLPPSPNLKPTLGMLRGFSQAQLRAWIAAKPHCGTDG
jgi:TonB family protein